MTPDVGPGPGPTPPLAPTSTVDDPPAPGSTRSREYCPRGLRDNAVGETVTHPLRPSAHVSVPGRASGTRGQAHGV